MHAGAYYALKDCDGDGIPDHTCSDATGQFGFFESTNDCKSTWPNGVCQGGNSLC